MNHTLTRRVLTGLVAAGLAGSVGAAPAFAEVDKTRDASHDVVEYVDDNTQVVKPKIGTVDVTREVTAYRDRALSMSVSFSDLTKPRTQRSEYIRVHTSEKKNFTVQVVSTRRNPGGTMTLTNRRGREIACDGLEHAYAWAKDKLTLSVPTACLSAPRWVQVGHGSITFSRGYKHIYIDDARLDSKFNTRDVVLGPKITKG